MEVMQLRVSENQMCILVGSIGEPEAESGSCDFNTALQQLMNRMQKMNEQLNHLEANGLRTPKEPRKGGHSLRDPNFWNCGQEDHEQHDCNQRSWKKLRSFSMSRNEFSPQLQ